MITTDLESEIKNLLESVLPADGQPEPFKPLSEAEKQRLSEAELLEYHIREILGDDLHGWNYQDNAMLTLSKHHYAAPAANDFNQ